VTQNEQPAEKRPTFWMWGDPITCHNPIREAWEAAQHPPEPMSEEAKARCAEVRAEKKERRKLRRRGR